MKRQEICAIICIKIDICNKFKSQSEWEKCFFNNFKLSQKQLKWRSINAIFIKKTNNIFK